MKKKFRVTLLVQVSVTVEERGTMEASQKARQLVVANTWPVVEEIVQLDVHEL